MLLLLLLLLAVALAMLPQRHWGLTWRMSRGLRRGQQSPSLCSAHLISTSPVNQQSWTGVTKTRSLTVVSGVLSLQVRGHVVLCRDKALVPYRQPIPLS